MTHEGRMSRGKEKLSKGVTDSETKYYLDNKPKEEPKKEVKKDGKPKSR